VAEVKAPCDLGDVVRAQERGEAVALPSICSAHPLVLDAAFAEAVADGAPSLVESTCNQVNPDGGYTGQTPRDFAASVRARARDAGLTPERLLLGGDHLGPHPWRRLPAAEAMAKARELVRQCVCAGYVKLHLDASMRLADDPGPDGSPPPPEVVSERAADLCAAAEEARAQAPAGTPAPLYVIGTDVPPPGGETGDATPPAVTAVADLERTLDLARRALAARGVDGAWPRVAAVVVQPGVDFTSTRVFGYEREKARPLRAVLAARGGLVFEGHSTDYQPEASLRALVEDRFGVLKVGPALTFEARRVVLGLEAIEREWLGSRKGTALSGVREALEAAMDADPRHWRDHHRDDGGAWRALRALGYADRVRYYWPAPAVHSAVERLFANLRSFAPPLPLLAQHLPPEYDAVRAGRATLEPAALVRHAVGEALRPYARACGYRP
jgi:D-tagatose-1,6-bisphosphate aldolase subunit GatZ/KbaZ